jgi:hypothetical protein
MVSGEYKPKSPDLGLNALDITNCYHVLPIEKLK